MFDDLFAGFLWLMVFVSALSLSAGLCVNVFAGFFNKDWAKDLMATHLSGIPYLFMVIMVFSAVVLLYHYEALIGTCIIFGELFFRASVLDKSRGWLLQGFGEVR